MPLSPPKSTLAVLVVDDSAVARLTVARRLRSEGFEVIEHASAATPEAAVIARAACALLDLDLGDSDGCQLARALLVQRAGLAIAFFSGSAARDLVESARQIGPVFAKPGELEGAVAWVRTNAR
jgi:CheY-like chemotaxis protein